MTTKLDEHSVNIPSPHNFAVKKFIINHRRNREHGGGLLIRVKYHSMDRIPELHKIESMRKMMVMQEQLFKQQVRDLHRLYDLQKKLMQEAGKGQKEIAEATESKQTSKASGERNHQKDASGSNSAENSRMPIKFDLEMPAETESITTPSSSIHPFEEQNGLKKMDDDEADVEVELTLSLGHRTRKQRSKNTQLHDSDQQQLASSSTGQDRGEEVYEQISLTGATVYQENTRPRWLLQDLSLNRT